jgi:hypothetical protein
MLEALKKEHQSKQQAIEKVTIFKGLWEGDTENV